MDNIQKCISSSHQAIDAMSLGIVYSPKNSSSIATPVTMRIDSIRPSVGESSNIFKSLLNDSRRVGIVTDDGIGLDAFMASLINCAASI